MPRTPLPLSFVPCLESKSENNKQCKTQSSKMAFKRRQAKAVYQRRSAPSQPFLPPCYSWGAISSLEKYFGQCRKEEPTPWNILSCLQKTEKSILLGGQILRENRLCVKLLISNFNWLQILDKILSPGILGLVARQRWGEGGFDPGQIYSSQDPWRGRG